MFSTVLRVCLSEVQRGVYAVDPPSTRRFSRKNYSPARFHQSPRFNVADGKRLTHEGELEQNQLGVYLRDIRSIALGVVPKRLRYLPRGQRGSASRFDDRA